MFDPSCEVPKVWVVLSVLQTTCVNILRLENTPLLFVASSVFPNHDELHREDRCDRHNIAATRSDERRNV